KSDAAVTQRWQQWVTQPDRKEPWFAYVNYSVPAAFDKAISQRSRGLENSNEDAIQATSATELEAKYAKAVTRVDEQLQKVFTTLQQDNLLQNTIVIITSDHGMEFNESGHNRWGYNQSFSPYELRVPLVIHWPGKPAATVQKLTSNLDVSTTLMQDLLHVTNPTSDYSQGENLFTPERKNNWILAGDANQLVIISPDQQMQLDNRGQFNAYDNNYKPLPEDKPRLAVLLQALKEVRRFITD
ncbi:MAG: sulfatase-like hydrolase/transferase, partial [Plesiomonas shigelloides]